MSTPTFDPVPVQWICAACREIRVLAEEPILVPSCLRCGCTKMRRLLQTLQAPRYMIVAIVLEDSMEERFFTFHPGQMAEPMLGSEVKLPLSELDPITETKEWKEAGGWAFIVKRCVDYVTGSLWVEAHFLQSEAAAMEQQLAEDLEHVDGTWKDQERKANGIPKLTPEEYKTARKMRGTQEEVAELLGVSRETVTKREGGYAGYPITTEASLALLQLPMKP